jgi:Cu/Ag efflux protein CusF
MKSIQRLSIVVALALSSTAALAAHATGAQDVTLPAASASASASAEQPTSEGEIRKVDKEGGKLTIKHGPLDNLGMAAMTMVFRVQDPSLLDRLKAGDKIRFVADMIDGQLTATQVKIEKQ